MLAKILVAVDGSAESEQALNMAAQIARGSKTQLILVHAFEKLPSIDAPHYRRSLREHLNKGQKVIEAAAALVADLVPELELLEGPAGDAILRVAAARDVDLIIMGARGIGGVRAMLGSVSNKVVHQATCPVLIAHEKPGVLLEAEDLSVLVPA
ncbi:MAG: universal stress protein [Anaerolineae bacterium]